ncbi:MAG: polymer-forming cytoskeletal protein [Desulfobacterales bacterium]|nr:polymer-forming cytoskeletal protein [Desulfobacterales bacterium]
MKKKRVMVMGFILVFLTFALCSFTYGAELGSVRFGKNVKVPTEETVSGGLVAAGANVEILGKVGGGLKACGANVVTSGDVQGEVRACGANVVLAGTYHSKVKAAASNLTLSGTFDGDVEVGGARITVAPTALIKGNLIYVSADLNLQKGSRIMGEVVQRQVMVKKERIEQWGRQGIKALIPVGIFFWLISLAALIIVGLLINYLFPKKTNAVINTISQSPWKNLWFGLIFLVVVPVAIIIAFITVVGIPAGIIAGILYGIAIYISSIYMGVWIGRKILGYLKKSMATAFFWPLVVGTIIIGLLTLIPFIGCLFRLCILLLSLGAMWLVMKKTVPAPAQRKAQRTTQRKTQRTRRPKARRRR